jgi:hypothetical protein
MFNEEALYRQQQHPSMRFVPSTKAEDCIFKRSNINTA